ncbi:hypothetical protein HYS50_00675 [Candidatus Woesearchaeota archaeon]|nr:hypothetical protein [Candidatus Woesearchaeota archaeon]
MSLARKNILDLEFQKHLNIASTAIIIFYTYLIAIGVGFVTKQITFDNRSLVFLSLFSTFIIGPSVVSFLRARKQLKKIPRIITALD